jgi:proteic killer suppression protein
VIESFWHRGLRELFETGKSARVRPDLHRRILVRLDAIDKAASPAALSQPGFDFHPLRGPVPRRYSIHVNGPWCITIEWREGRALRVDLEQYH